MSVITWAGGTGSFSDPSQWLGSLVPTTTDVVDFSLGGTVEGTGSVQEIEVDPVGGTITASAITFTGSFTAQTYAYQQGARIALTSGATLTATHDTAIDAEAAIDVAGGTTTASFDANGATVLDTGSFIFTDATLTVENHTTVDAGSPDQPAASFLDGLFLNSTTATFHQATFSLGTFTLDSFGSDAGTKLTLDQGSTVTAANALLGGGGGVNATIGSVSGTGTKWTNEGVLNIGVGGSGTLTVSSNASITAKNTLTVGRTVVSGGATTAGTGALSILSGATASSGAGVIAVGTTGTGIVTVSGTASDWGVNGPFQVGESGVGTLLVNGGGSVSVTNFSSASLVAGDQGGATGIVTVDGSGSTLAVSGSATIGNAGSGTLEVQSGAGVMLAALIIAAQSTSGSDSAPDSVTVDGTGSTLAVTGDATIDSATPPSQNSQGNANGTFGVWSYTPSGIGQIAASNSGLVTIGGTLTLQAPDDDSAPPTVTIDAGSEIEVGGTGSALAGALVVDAGGLVAGHGTISADVVGGAAPAGAVITADGGTVEAREGTLDLDANVAGGGFSIDTNATLHIEGTADAATVVSFATAEGAPPSNYSNTLVLSDPADFAGSIENFSQGDTLYLPNFTPSASFIGITSFTDGISIQGLGTLNLTGSDPVPTIGFKPDSNGGTDLETVNVQTLLDLALDTYLAPFNGADGYKKISVAPADGGFEAVAYEDMNTLDGDPSIVIAFRGTFLNTLQSLVKNILADSSFLFGVPNALLQRYVADAADFTFNVAADNPKAQIMLAGHSLGGALAQLVGEASGFGAAAFNAPGSGQLFDALQGSLGLANNLGDGGTNINYRVTGDAVSFAGTPMRQTWSVPSTVGTNGSTPLPTAVSQVLTNHLALPDMQSAPYTEGFTAPDLVSVLQQAAQGTTKGLVLNIKLQVQAAVLNLIDPSGGSSFTLAGAAGSPNIATILLPEEPGVATYDVARTIGGMTSAFTQVAPGASYDLPAGVTAVTFDPLDASVVIPSAFYLGVAFATSGTFTGTLAETNSPPFAGPVAGADTVTLEPGAGATPLGIPAPTDPSDSNPADFGTLVTALPTDATVTLADGTTPVSLDEALTTAQLTSLEVKPDSGAAGATSAFAYTVTDETFASADGSATVAVACYTAGTSILTCHGEVPVEALRAGDRVISLVHRCTLPIRWIGSRTTTHAAPVRVAASAFGPGTPLRDLWLSPDHALFIDGALMPVRHLINGATVQQLEAAKVTYFHIELPSHDIVLADGLPAETYLDTGNRVTFEMGDRTSSMSVSRMI